MKINNHFSSLAAFRTENGSEMGGATIANRMTLNVSEAEYIGTLQTFQFSKSGELRAHYDAPPEEYDEYNLKDANSKAHLHIAQAFFTLALATNSMILEIGPATGSLGQVLHSAGYSHIHAMDLSPQMLHSCKSLGNVYVRFIPHFVQVGRPLPIAPQSYDVLLLSNVMFPLAFSFPELKHAISLVKPGGLVGFNLFLGAFSSTLDGNFTDEGYARNTKELVTSGLLEPVPGLYPKTFENHYSWKPGAVYFGYVK